MKMANRLGAAILLACVMLAECQDVARPKLEVAPAAATAQAAAPACSVADGFTIAAVGDLIYSEPLSSLKDDSFQTLIKLLHSTDVSFSNLENTLIDLSTFSRLRLIVFSLNDPSLEKNYNSGGIVAKETGEDARTAHIQLLHDATHQSVLELSIVR